MTLFSFIYQKRVRDLFWQAVVLVSVVSLLAFFVLNASRNMREAGIASGFDFLFRTAGIEIPFVLTNYTPQSDNLALLWVGIVNTMLITVVAAAAATALGFVIGIARLSRNWLLSTIAGAYVEAVRNIPLLFFVLFWYFGVIATLPGPRQSIGIFGIAFLNNRGLTIPLPNYVSPFGKATLVILAALAIQIAFAWWARRRRDRTGKHAPVWTIGTLLLLVLPIIA
ncbi:MAG: ral L-amino acid transport system permease protein, partial [Hyphomicrobiales bacterium]|nr:ral L-amino acid transport system permease protein [Hyphomicrobiales bacterium]